MAFLNPLLLSALGLMAIPVILHLLLRPKPKQLIFPALRLIRERRKKNVRRFRIKHWWLLFLRMAAIGMIVFALTRPTLPAANYSLTRSELLTLITVVCAGIATYFLILNRWQRQSLPKYVFDYRRTSLRTWSTAAVLLAMALAVGWPYQRRVRAEIKAPPTTRQLDIPVAAVFLFDSSLSMGYQTAGKTRLEEAQRLALDHLSELPAGSRVAVAENSADNPFLFQPTLNAAQERIEALTINPVSYPIGDRIRSALLAQRDDRERVASEFGAVADSDDESLTASRDRYIRRIYIFTDLSRSAWNFTGSRILQGEIAEFENLGIYLVDVGVLESQNLGITDIGLSKQRVPVGGNLYVTATVLPRGMAGRKQILELYLADAAGNLAKHGQQEVSLLGDVPQQIQFPQLTGLTGSVVHGEVRLVSSDPLDVDDVRRFSVEIGEPPRVLVFAPVASMADNWQFALNPTDNIKFEVEVRSASQIDQPFGNVDVIYLINIPEITDADWRRLGQFVGDGGGLGIFLGSDQIKAVSYNRAQAQNFLPATVGTWESLGTVKLSLEDVNHPLLRKYQSYSDGTAIMENDVRVYRFWRVEPHEGAPVLMTYTDPDQCPALIESVHGNGRVVMFTTAIDVQPHPWRWNNFPLPSAIAWTYLAFAEQMTEHLAGSTDVVVNYSAGEDPFVTMTPEPEERTYSLRAPRTQTPVTLSAGESTLVLDNLKDLGHYDLLTQGDRRDLVTGFSINPPPGESDFTRLLDEELDQLLGKDAYSVARSIDELQGEIEASDIGQEMFPIILVLAIVFFCSEHFVANRFYDPQAEAAAQSPQQASQTT